MKRFHTDIEHDVLTLIAEAESAGKTWSDLLDEIFARYFDGKQWEVFVEIMVAARTNVALRERLAPVIENYYGEVDRVWQQNFVTTSAETDVATLLNLSFCVIRGMAFQGLVRDKPAYYAEMMQQWKRMIGPLVDSRWQE